MNKKNYIIAGLLSFVFPGLGHFYLGLWGRGLIFLGASLIAGIPLIIYAPSWARIVFLITIAAIYDAGKQAKKMNAV